MNTHTQNKGRVEQVCPDCAKALAAYNRLDARMAQRGNFGIVPLPQLCKKHLAEKRQPLTPPSRR